MLGEVAIGATRDSPLRAMFRAIRRAPSRSSLPPARSEDRGGAGEEDGAGDGNGGVAAAAGGGAGAGGVAARTGAGDAGAAGTNGIGPVSRGRRLSSPRAPGSHGIPYRCGRRPGGESPGRPPHVRRRRRRARPCSSRPPRGRPPAGWRRHAGSRPARRPRRPSTRRARQQRAVARRRRPRGPGPARTASARVCAASPSACRARLRASCGGFLLDLGGRRLGGLEDALHLGAGARRRASSPRAAFQRVAQLLDLARRAPAGARPRPRGHSPRRPIGKSRFSMLCRSSSTR